MTLESGIQYAPDRTTFAPKFFPDHSSSNPQPFSPELAVFQFLHHVDKKVSPQMANLIVDQLAIHPEEGLHTIHVMYLTGLLFPNNMDLVRSAGLHDIGKQFVIQQPADLQAHRQKTSEKPQSGAETRSQEQIALDHSHPALSFLAIQQMAAKDNPTSFGYDLLWMNREEARLARAVGVGHHENGPHIKKPSYLRSIQRPSRFNKIVEMFTVIDLAAALIGHRQYRKDQLSFGTIHRTLHEYVPHGFNRFIHRIMIELRRHEQFFRIPQSMIGLGMYVYHHGQTRELYRPDQAGGLLKLGETIWASRHNRNRIDRTQAHLMDKVFVDQNRHNQN